MDFEGKITNGDYENEKTCAPEMDYKMECDRLWKENSEQRTIIKALIFYIEEEGGR